MNKNGIHHEPSVPDTPKQKGVAERGNRTIVISAKTMLHSSGLPNSPWAEAVECAVYIKNRVLSSSSIEKLTPFEAYHGRNPDVSHLRIFRCDAFLHIIKERREKFSPKAVQCKLAGYWETQKAYRLWDDANVPETLPHKIDDEETDVLMNPDVIRNVAIENDETSVPTTPVLPLGHERPRRDKKAPLRWSDEPLHPRYSQTALIASTMGEPQTMKEALTLKDAKKLMEATEAELASLAKKQTWTLTELPKFAEPSKASGCSKSNPMKMEVPIDLRQGWWRKVFLKEKTWTNQKPIHLLCATTPCGPSMPSPRQITMN